MQYVADKMHKVMASARTTKQRQAAKRYYVLYRALIDKTRREFVRHFWPELFLVLIGCFIFAVFVVVSIIVLW